MKKKTVYVISHSHLDREWYMPYEQHHMRVVELFDDILETFENDPNFKYFHLDGQTIPVDDYLEVKPQNREKVMALIKSGKLRIGPFYILQDDFLISAESNVRNTLIGMKESKKYGQPVKLGYFPDTFGNMGQTPQMMKQMGLESAAFGRGVKPIGTDNQVLEDENYTSQYSEMNWQGPDGSEIFGLLFANWYSNGNEIPTEKEAAIAFWDQKLADVEKYASTDHLLMMNGVDHQPLQKDVGQAIALANELYPDYHFIHSHFDEYLMQVMADVPADLGKVSGELTSQETDGWYTLANTASSRIYLKQENVKTQSLIENQGEVLATFAKEVGKEYPKEVLEYAWKLLLQNHPHDSICGCSVDEVHREMMTRFAKASETAKYVIDESLTALSDDVDTSQFNEDSFPVIVANTSNTSKTGEVTVVIEIDRIPFQEKWPKLGFETLEAKPTPAFKIVDQFGETVQSEIIDVQVSFGYDLPKDAFRVPYMAKYVTANIYVTDLAPMSLTTFALQPTTEMTPSANNSLLSKSGRVLENDQISVEISDDGSLQMTNKETGRVYTDQLIFEDTGDIGNEYIYRQSGDGQTFYSTDFTHDVSVIKDNETTAQVKLTHHMTIPVSADDTLKIEANKVVDITNRQAGRSDHHAPFTIETVMTLYKDSPQVHFETTMVNEHKDHRVRVLFPSDLDVDRHYAESIFEAVERPNKVSNYWKNPTNPQHQHAFVNSHDNENGVTIGNVGLNEYEVLPERTTMALTLLRSVGEMGDWGYFPTPEAQCLGETVLTYTFEAHSESSYFDSLQRAIALKTPLAVKQTAVHSGKLASTHQFVTHHNPSFVMTALKEADQDDSVILRGYNLDNEYPSPLIMTVPGKEGVKVNLLEEESEPLSHELQPAEILTSKWQSN